MRRFFLTAAVLAVGAGAAEAGPLARLFGGKGGGCQPAPTTTAVQQTGCGGCQTAAVPAFIPAVRSAPAPAVQTGWPVQSAPVSAAPQPAVYQPGPVRQAVGGAIVTGGQAVQAVGATVQSGGFARPVSGQCSGGTCK